MKYFYIPLLSISFVIIALFHQHFLGMEPCAWCVLQRFFFIAIFLFSLIGLFLNKLKIGALFGISLLATGGIFTAIYQTFWANSSNSCDVSFADKFISYTQLNTLLPNVFESYALCADTNIYLLGIPYSGWGLISFIILSILSDVLLVKSLKPISSSGK
jgi:protein dithiol:quinone oxidoreductase